MSAASALCARIMAKVGVSSCLRRVYFEMDGVGSLYSASKLADSLPSYLEYLIRSKYFPDDLGINSFGLRHNKSLTEGLICLIFPT